MTDYISRQDAVDALKIDVEHTPAKETERENICNSFDSVRKRLLDLPSAPVREVVYGEWVIKNGGLYCSKCGSKALLHDNKRTQDYDYRESKFCPNCGASMR